MRLTTIASLVSFLFIAAPLTEAAQSIDNALDDALQSLDRSKIPTGILYDRVLPLSQIEAHDGSAASKPITLSGWKQIYSEMSRASFELPTWPALGAFLADRGERQRAGRFPIALAFFNYDRIRPDALQDGSLEVRGGRLIDTGAGDPFEQSAVFAATALKDYTYRGQHVVFTLDPAAYASNDPRLPRHVEIDFGDGRGFRKTRLDGEHVVRYPSAGRKTVRVHMTLDDGVELKASFYFEVKSLQAPMPHDTLMITATIPYNSEFGTGEAYVYRSDVNTTLSQPVILVEGFDLDNTMNWDELYELVNQEGLLDSLRAAGYDAVVLNFADAVDYVQKNAFVLVELIEQVQAMIAPTAEYSLVGASMGGLVARYALSYMESNTLPHRVRLFVSFDSPQNGANIPLGVQHWVDFFSSQSTDAQALLDALNSPAARQMLVYHHSVLPSTSAGPDPLRAALETDLTAVGEYPSEPRKVAVANGGSTQVGQGFSPGDQIISWDYSSLLVNLTGDVWAVSAGATQLIFDGLISIFLILNDTEAISVTGTMPYDNAPGGYRGSMAQMDSTEAPYGDIIALHPDHCFIPTISALDLATTDLFYDIAGDGNLLALTPFDEVYVPATNEGHVEINPDNADFILGELIPVLTGVVPEPAIPLPYAVHQNFPNPFNPVTTIPFYLPARDQVLLKVFSVDGTELITLVDEVLGAGSHDANWNGRDRDGRSVASGIYFYRLETGTFVGTRKMVLLK